MEKYIISIGAGRMQVPLIEAIKKIGHKVIGIDRDPKAQGKVLCDVFINESTHDSEGIFEKLTALNLTDKIENILVKSSGIPILTAAKLAQKLGLKFIPAEAVEMVLDKRNLMDAMKASSVSCPRRIENLGDFFPVVIKPAVGTSSKSSIYLIKDEMQLESLKLEDDNFNKLKNFEVEEYIEGSDCTIFTAVEDSKIKYYTILDELNRFIDNRVEGFGFSVPSIFENTKVDKRILEESSKILKVLRLEKGIAWMSFRVREGIPYLIEIHLDMAGEFILDKLLSIYTEKNCIQEVVKLYCGRENFNVGSCKDKYSIFFTNRKMQNLGYKMNLINKNFDVVEKSDDCGLDNHRTGYFMVKNVNDCNDIVDILIG